MPKSLCSLLLALGFVSYASGQTCVPPPAGLVAWWPCDGNAVDIIGLNNATMVNGASFATGFVGQAFSLDGIDDLVNLGGNNIIGSGNDPFTVAAWMFPTRIPTGSNYFLIRLKQDTQFFIGFNQDFLVPGGFVGAMFRGAAHQWLTPINHSSILNQWTHVAVTYNGGDKSAATSFAIFFNGVQLPTGSVDLGPVGGFCNDNAIGSDTGSSCIDAFPFQGLIDEVQIYSRVLPSSDIHALFNAGNAGTCNAGPLTYNLLANPDPVPTGTALVVSGTVSDSATGNSNINLAELSIDGGVSWPYSTGPFGVPVTPVSFNLPAFGTTGVRNICVRGTDAVNNVGPPECIYLPVYDPAAGFVTGGGWIQSPVGAYAPNPALSGKANFGFVSKYLPGVQMPSGNSEFRFQAADFRFQSTSYDWLVVAGARAQFKGSGVINGTGYYGFLLTAIDGQSSGGGGTDNFRIKIWNKTPNGGEGSIVYDNKMGAQNDVDPDLVIGGGSIVIHR